MTDQYHLESQNSSAAGNPQAQQLALPMLIKLAGRLLLRNWRGGELNLLILSLLLAISTVTSINLFSNRIQNSIYDEAAELLAADAVISGGLPLEQQWINTAKQQSLQHAQFVAFRAMAFAGNEMRLTLVKAVDDTYPLKGELKVQRQGDIESVFSGPQPGEAWLAPRLFDALGVVQGESIEIGEAQFTVTAAIVQEPDNGQSLFGVAPRVMIHQHDVERTSAVQIGSRVSYTLQVAGDSAKVAKFEELVRPTLGVHFRWIDAKSNNRSVSSALQRGERFLLLASSLGVLLSGAAIAIASRRYASRQAKYVALLKTLGSTPKEITIIYITILSLIAAVSIICGSLLGFILHFGIIAALGDLMPQQLSHASISAYWTGALTGVIALWSFAGPPLLALRNVSPASAINDAALNKRSGVWLHNFIALFAMIFLIVLFSRDIQLTVYLTLGLVLCFCGVLLLSTALISTTKIIARHVHYSWRLGLINLQRHRKYNALQIAIFSILLFLIFLLSLVRTGLIDQWQNQLPDDTANHFVFNIFSHEIDQIKTRFGDANINHSPFFPMTRGRIVDVNGDSLKDRVEANTNRGMNYEREINLTWSNTLGSDNKILQGDWWGKNTENELLVSAEQEYAQGLGIELNDLVTFSVAGQTVTAKVASIRSVEWDSMNPNFFMIMNQPILNGIGSNWLTSFYLPIEKKSFINQLTKDFPTISLIELDQTLDQVKSIIAKITLAIEFILVLILISGFMVLIASIQATIDFRLKESAILRTLGADKPLINKTLIIEFAAIGMLAGIIATVATEASLFMLQTFTFDLRYSPQFLLWAIGPMIGIILIASVGWLSTKKVVNTPPLAILKNI